MSLIVDKSGAIDSIPRLDFVQLELGCSGQKTRKDAIGIDLLDAPGVDIVGEASAVLATLPPDCADKICSSHMFEHVTDVAALLLECQRVLRPGGQLEVVVPHFSNAFFYSDPTHRTFFGLYTFCYFARGGTFRRTIPGYARLEFLELEEVRLVFKTFRPRYISYGFRKIVERIVNLASFTQEIYEDSFSRLIPCYEIHFHLRKSHPD
jgi:ubiquinone/menaquinone biosynthesis C-methylase UbiE